MQFGNHHKGWTVIDSVLGVSVCLVSVKPPARGAGLPQVLAVAQAPLPDEGALLPALTAVLGKAAGKLPQMLTLERRQYRLRVMAQPVVPARELLDSLRWELMAESGHDGADFNLAWMPIPTTEHLPDRPLQGYAVMTPSAWLDAEMALWRMADLRPKVVDVRETALRNLAGALERDGEGLALLSADHEGVTMVFTHGKSLFFDRFIEQPLAEMQAADAPGRARLHERIAVQLLRSLDQIARNYPFISVNRVVVAPGPVPTGLTDFLTGQLPLRVEPLDLAQAFDLEKVPQLAQSLTLQARCLVPLGAALRSHKDLS